MGATVALLRAMQARGVPLDMTDSGPLPGMFALRAHSDAAVRKLAEDTMTAKLPPLSAELFEEGHDQWGTLVDTWVRRRTLVPVAVINVRCV